MRIATSVLVFGVASCLGCGEPPEKEAYARLAQQANPILISMRPTAMQLLSLSPSREELNTQSLPETKATALASACMSADEQLWKLRKIDFARPPFGPEGGKASVDEYAGWLLDRRSVHCGHGQESRIKMCALACYDEWSGLIDEVERVRREAQKYGVTLSSLRE